MLDAQGCVREETDGKSHGLYRLTPNFPVYVRESNGIGSAIFFDAAYSDLAKLLATIKGIQFSDDGVRKNSKFSAFVHGKSRTENHVFEYEGWKLYFTTEQGCQAFLAICTEYGRSGMEGATSVSRDYEKKTVRTTSRQSSAISRLGQNDFRRALLKLWKSCAICGCKIEAVLRASHIKPWSISTAEERLDPFNGLLLIANLDALFDAGLIGFDEEGGILISSTINPAEHENLGINPSMRLRKINAAHKPYLQYHRQYLFIK
jgi:HNH endonuclease